MHRIIKNYFIFTKGQQQGLFLLVLLIITIQIIYFFVEIPTPNNILDSKKNWLALQTEIDSLKNRKSTQKHTIYPFNPNFITDFKGYKLGMSVQEIDKLLAFRKKNKYVNSAKEFQIVTGISNELLAKIAPYFKFPDWVKNKRTKYQYTDFNNTTTKKNIVIKDINAATSEDLISLFGIGEATANRILKYKESFGNFVSMEQMNDVWGLSPEVLQELDTHFKIIKKPTITKISINELNSKDLAKFPYFKYPLSREIIIFRSMNNGIHSVEDLSKIKGFPVEKIKIIDLYLDYN